jgi:hypothetical protein
MKKMSTTIARTALMLAAVLILLPAITRAQGDSTKKSTVAAEEIAIAPALTLVTVQKPAGAIDLKASLRFKTKGVTLKLTQLKVHFQLVTDTATKDLGSVITDRIGNALLTVKAGELNADKEGKLHFKAVFAGNKQMEATEAEATLKTAVLALTAEKADSVYTAKLKLTDLASGAAIPKTTVSVWVKREFNALKLGEGTTDDNGEATVEVPAKIPGDAKGNIVLLGRVDENETLGNMESSLQEPWGVAVSDKNQQLPRALWSSHPPIWMLVTFLILVTTVWGHYIVIIFELFRLRKEEPNPAPGAPA